jgi:transcriptional antiterminator NusG
VFDDSNNPIDTSPPSEPPREGAAESQAAETAGQTPPAEIPSGEMTDDTGGLRPISEANAKYEAAEKATAEVPADSDQGPDTSVEASTALDTAGDQAHPVPKAAETHLETNVEPAAGKPEGQAPAEAKSDKMDWYILKVQSNREESIRDGLLRRVAIAGLDYYFGDVIVPTEKVTEFKGGKKRVTKRKLYPGYIVVQMEINDDTWFLVRETPGIGDFTGAAGLPTPMLEHEVSRIVTKAEEKTDEAPKLKIAFSPGDRVKINDGTFENFEGEVDTIDATNGRVTVMINIFGRSTPVELEYWQIEAL